MTFLVISEAPELTGRLGTEALTRLVVDTATAKVVCVTYNLTDATAIAAALNV